MDELIAVLLQLPNTHLSGKQIKRIKAYLSPSRKGNGDPQPHGYRDYVKYRSEYHLLKDKLAEAIHMWLTCEGGHLEFTFQRCNTEINGDSLLYAVITLLPSNKYILKQLLPKLEKATDIYPHNDIVYYLTVLYVAVKTKLDTLNPRYKEPDDKTVVAAYKRIIRQSQISAERQLSKNAIEIEAIKILPQKTRSDAEYKDLISRIVKRVREDQDMMRLSKAYNDPTELLLYYFSRQCDFLFKHLIRQAAGFIQSDHPDFYAAIHSDAQKKSGTLIEAIFIKLPTLPADHPLHLNLLISKLKVLSELQSCFSSEKKSADALKDFYTVYLNRKGILSELADETTLGLLKEIDIIKESEYKYRHTHQHDTKSIRFECDRYLEKLFHTISDQLSKHHEQLLSSVPPKLHKTFILNLITKQQPEGFHPNKSLRLAIIKYNTVSGLKNTLSENANPIENLLKFEREFMKHHEKLSTNVDSPTKQFLNAIGKLLGIKRLQSKTEKERTIFIKEVTSTLFAKSRMVNKHSPLGVKTRLVYS